MTRDIQHCERELFRRKVQFLSNLELLPVELLDLASLDEQQDEEQPIPPELLDNIAMVLVNLASPSTDQELENEIGEMSSGDIVVEAAGSSSSTDNVSHTCESEKFTRDVKSFIPESTPTKSTKCKDPERDYEENIEQLKLFLLDGREKFLPEEILTSNFNELLASSTIELQTELKTSTPGSEKDELETIDPVTAEFLLDLSNDNTNSDVKDLEFILDCDKEETINRLEKYSNDEIPDEDIRFLTSLIDEITKEVSNTGGNNFDARNATAESILHSDIQKGEQNSSNSSIQYLLDDVRHKVVEKTMPNSNRSNEHSSSCDKSIEFSLNDEKNKILERMIPSSIEKKDNKPGKLKGTTNIKSILNNTISISPKHENRHKNGKLKEVLLDRKATTNIKSELSRKNEIQDEIFQIEQLKQFLLDDA